MTTLGSVDIVKYIDYHSIFGLLNMNKRKTGFFIFLLVLTALFLGCLSEETTFSEEPTYTRTWTVLNVNVEFSDGSNQLFDRVTGYKTVESFFKEHTVDVSFKDGSYQQYEHVTGWETVEVGMFSDTIDLRFGNEDSVQRLHYVTDIKVLREGKPFSTIDLEFGVDDRIQRLNYVTSVDVISEYQVTKEITKEEYYK